MKGDDEDDLQFTIRRLGAFFEPKRNVVSERYKFRIRGQAPGETTAQWVSALRQMASTCDYLDRTDELVRDRVVERTSSSRLRQRLLMEPDLSLTKCLTIAESVESAEMEAQAMEASAYSSPRGAPGSSVQAVQHRSRAAPPSRRPTVPGRHARGAVQPRRVQQSTAPPAGAPARAEDGVVTCFSCGGGHKESFPRCPARGVRCHSCGKAGHFAKMCNDQSSAAGARVVSSVQVLAVNGSLCPNARSVRNKLQTLRAIDQ